MKLFDIKRVLARCPLVFNFTKYCFNSAKNGVSYFRRRNSSQEKLLQIKTVHKQYSKVIWYFGVATHPNLGDLAQTNCTFDWLKKLYPDALVIDISSEQFYFCPNKFMSLLKKIVKISDLIVFQSGYTMTHIHEHEAMRKQIISTFVNNRIVILPQTIFYKTKADEKWAVETYKDLDNLLLLARDRVSYETAKKLFGKTEIVLFPDIVTTLIGNMQFSNEREGILFCVRDDWERYYSDKQMKELIGRISKLAPTATTDTSIKINNTEDRAAVWKLVCGTIEEYSKYKLIITDRYHGTIFALAAGTPVIVLKTTDHKVITGAEWFKPLIPEYIFVASDLCEAELLVHQVLERTYEYKISAYFADEYYSKLSTFIEGGAFHANL